jgi:hypothetical protein
MTYDLTFYIIGSAVGFFVFIVSTSSMEGIFFRPNSKGEKHFTLSIFKDYLKSPFKVGTHEFNIVWGNLRGMSWRDRIKMLQLNWVAMVGTGLAFSALTLFIKKKFFV